ncbi:MAG: hypothetical protein Q4G68_05425 [Planctomycetia bacterium]|nr:hypothetical protein [Planctomycetia bacterium]
MDKTGGGGNLGRLRVSRATRIIATLLFGASAFCCGSLFGQDARTTYDVADGQSFTTKTFTDDTDTFYPDSTTGVIYDSTTNSITLNGGTFSVTGNTAPDGTAGEYFLKEFVTDEFLLGTGTPDPADPDAPNNLGTIDVQGKYSKTDAVLDGGGNVIDPEKTYGTEVIIQDAIDLAGNLTKTGDGTLTFASTFTTQTGTTANFTEGTAVFQNDAIIAGKIIADGDSVVFSNASFLTGSSAEIKTVATLGNATFNSNATFDKATAINGTADFNADSVTEFKDNATITGIATFKENSQANFTNADATASFESDANFNGNTTVAGDTQVTGNAVFGTASDTEFNTATFKSDANFNGNMTVAADAQVNGDATFDGNADFDGNATVGGEANFNGKTTTVAGKTTVTGVANFNNGSETKLEGGAELGNAANFSGNADTTVTGKTTVAGKADLKGTSVTKLNGDAEFNNELALSDTANVTVTGNTTVAENATFGTGTTANFTGADATATFKKDATFDGNADFAGAATVNGIANFNGKTTTVAGKTTVTGDANFGADSETKLKGGAQFDSDANFNGNTTVTGATTVAENADFSGNTTIDGTANVTGTADFNGKVTTITGKTTVTGVANFNDGSETKLEGGAELGNAANFSGNADTTVTGKTTVAGKADFKGTSVTKLNGDAEFNDQLALSDTANVTVTGNTTVAENATFGTGTTANFTGADATATFKKDATFDGNADFAGNANVNGLATFNNGATTNFNTATLQGGAAFNDGTTVTGTQANLGGSVTIDGNDVNFDKTTFLAGSNANINSAADLGDVTFNGEATYSVPANINGTADFNEDSTTIFQDTATVTGMATFNDGSNADFGGKATLQGGAAFNDGTTVTGTQADLGGTVTIDGNNVNFDKTTFLAGSNANINSAADLGDVTFNGEATYSVPANINGTADFNANSVTEFKDNATITGIATFKENSQAKFTNADATASFESDATFGGNADFAGAATVKGNANFNGKTTTVKKLAKIIGNANFNDGSETKLEGGAELGNAANFSGNADTTVTGKTTVAGKADFKGTSKTNLNGDAEFNNQLALSDTANVTVTGNTIVAENATFGIGTTANFTGADATATFKKDATFDGNADFAGAANVNGIANFNGKTTTVAGKTTVTGDANFGADSETKLKGGAQFDSDANFNGNTTVTGATTVAENADFSGNTTIDGTANVTGTADFNGKVTTITGKTTVTGVANFNDGSETKLEGGAELGNAANFSGNADTTVTGKTTVAGKADFKGTSVTKLNGDAEFNDQLALSDTANVTVTGNTTVAENATFANGTTANFNTATFDKDADFSGKATFDGTAAVTGTADFKANSVTEFKDNATITGMATFDKDSEAKFTGAEATAEFNGGADFGGTAKFANNATVNGIANFNGNTTIDNTAIVNGEANFKGETTIGGAATVDGIANFNGKVTTITGKTTVTGDANFNKDSGTLLNGESEFGSETAGVATFNQGSTTKLQGDATFNNNVVFDSNVFDSGAEFGGGTYFANNATVNGTAAFNEGSTTNFTGTGALISLNDKATFNGNTTVAGNTQVAGAAVFGAKSDTNFNTATFAQTADFSGKALFNGAAAVTGTADFNDGSETEFKDNATITGVATFDKGSTANFTGTGATVTLGNDANFSGNATFDGTTIFNGAAIFNKGSINQDIINQGSTTVFNGKVTANNIFWSYYGDEELTTDYQNIAPKTTINNKLTISGANALGNLSYGTEFGNNASITVSNGGWLILSGRVLHGDNVQMNDDLQGGEGWEKVTNWEGLDQNIFKTDIKIEKEPSQSDYSTIVNFYTEAAGDIGGYDTQYPQREDEVYVWSYYPTAYQMLNGKYVYVKDGNKYVRDSNTLKDAAFVYEKQLTGDGTVYKTGWGALKFTADQNGFSGDVNIAQGILAVDAGKTFGQADDNLSNLSGITTIYGCSEDKKEEKLLKDKDYYYPGYVGILAFNGSSTYNTGQLVLQGFSGKVVPNLIYDLTSQPTDPYRNGGMLWFNVTNAGQNLATINTNSMVIGDGSNVYYDGMCFLSDGAMVTTVITTKQAGTTEDAGLWSQTWDDNNTPGEKTQTDKSSLEKLFSKPLVSARVTQVEDNGRTTYTVTSTRKSVQQFGEEENLPSNDITALSNVLNNFGVNNKEAQDDDYSEKYGSDHREYNEIDAYWNDTSRQRLKNLAHNMGLLYGVTNFHTLTSHIGQAGSPFFFGNIMGQGGHGGGSSLGAGSSAFGGMGARGQVADAATATELATEAERLSLGTGASALQGSSDRGKTREFWASPFYTSISADGYDGIDGYIVGRTGMMAGVRRQYSDQTSAGALVALAFPKLSQNGQLAGLQDRYASEMEVTDFQFAAHMEHVYENDFVLSLRRRWCPVGRLETPGMERSRLCDSYRRNHRQYVYLYRVPVENRQAERQLANQPDDRNRLGAFLALRL